MACVMNCFRSNEADHRADTAEATDKFSNGKLLGDGGFGIVFEATLGGKKVAIKKLKIGRDERPQSKEESEKEIKVVSQVSHKNLVKLFGYCIEGDDILLVLEYVPKKSLRHHLHMVADFGLELLFPETGSLTHITRLNKGNEFYAEAEHYPTQNVAKKSYVYSYNNPESSGSNNIEPNGSQKLKPHVSSKTNESHNFEPNEAHTVESNGSLEPKPLVSSEVNRSHNVEPNGSQKQKPLISSEVNESHNVEPNGSQKPKPLVNLEAYNGIEQRQFTSRELAIATNGSSDTTNGTERFQDHQQRKINFQEDYQPRRFTYQELTTATGGFSEDNRLDEGALGQVYKGDLNGEKVAVKKFNNPRKQEEEYTKMKAIASGYHHKDLVNLIGCCEEGANRLLIYEFVPQLDTWHAELKRLGEDGCWCIFHVACILSAEALANERAKENIYSWHMPVHWKDAFFFYDHHQHKMYGSEYTSTLKFTEKTTVYSYGVMLLEMITGEEHFDDIVQWILEVVKGKLDLQDLYKGEQQLTKQVEPTFGLESLPKPKIMAS
ncbi:probable receptor-like serine/threonine-protein kinase At4g34500 [Hevea brasiliensis]|uniref:probable receptor-like serine/threonine-protein kinase At4g34500 n=1 Tax=Hevea brasiliensis TaxID=3981 RepID=UPI0025D373FB|nr:probable receptor-like serine/threonine-protein kinase At4g34500 [Hevea brasiliensis]